MNRLLLIALGGDIGTGLRYLTALFAVHWWGDQFPYGSTSPRPAPAIG